MKLHLVIPLVLVSEAFGQGAWEPSFQLGTAPSFEDKVRAVHMIHVFDGTTGRILVLPDHSQSQASCGETAPRSDMAKLWTPSSTSGAIGSIVSVPLCRSSLFCSGHSAMADGRILVIGGDHPVGLGLEEVNIFELGTGGFEWNKDGEPESMTYGRWYPTATTLPDGRVLASAGFLTYVDEDSNNDLARIPEVFDPATGRWTVLPQAEIPEIEFTDYPWMFVLPNGDLVTSGPRGSRLLTTSTFTWGAYIPEPASPAPARPSLHGSAAMYEPGKIMKCGGEPGTPGSALASTYMIDLSVMNPSQPPGWIAASNMNRARQNHNLVVLPDGKILAIGGCEDEFAVDPVLEAEVFDPQTGQWTLQPALDANRPRPYHSTALLLADGRVVAAGGFDQTSFSAQIFKPAYITAGLPRPTIVSVTSQWQYGDPYDIQFVNFGKPVTQACLIRLGSVTHGFDQDQRRVPLTVTSSATIDETIRQITVKAPENANLAPPGDYTSSTRKESTAGFRVPRRSTSASALEHRL